MECQACLVALGSGEEDTACHCAPMKAPQQWILHSHHPSTPQKPWQLSVRLGTVGGGVACEYNGLGRCERSNFSRTDEGRERKQFCVEGDDSVKCSLWQLIACILLFIGNVQCCCVAAL